LALQEPLMSMGRAAARPMLMPVHHQGVIFGRRSGVKFRCRLTHYTRWLKGEGPRDEDLGRITDWIPRDGETKEIKELKWEASEPGSSWKVWDDKSNALGGIGVKGSGSLELERKGDEVLITGMINQHAEDTYDYGLGDDKDVKEHNEWLPQGILGGDPFLNRKKADVLEKAGGAKPFTVRTKPWSKTLTGRLKLDKNGKIIDSHFEWKR
ncbi:MAG: hypothetical protein AB1744_10850, partial [Candidatus Zixiibacteriota bacterium]